MNFKMGDDKKGGPAGVVFEHNLWFTEELSPFQTQRCAVGQVFYRGKSEFQSVDVLELLNFGRTLVLDGKIQSCSVDERIYHESLVQPALMAHPNPKKVFIGGGGEGATAREILRNKSVEKCLMVDIDPIVCETSKKFLEQHHAGAFDNPRFQLSVEDAKKHLYETKETYDVMVMDLADPMPGGPCYLLYTQDFYQNVKKKMSADGILVTQSGPCGYPTAMDVSIPVNRTLSTVFKYVATYTAHVPSFSDVYSFCIASDTIDVSALSAEEVDKRIEERLDGTHELTNLAKMSGEDPRGANLMEFYDGETHRNMFSNPKWFRRQLKNDNRDVISDNNPAYMCA